MNEPVEVTTAEAVSDPREAPASNATTAATATSIPSIPSTSSAAPAAVPDFRTHLKHRLSDKVTRGLTVPAVETAWHLDTLSGRLVEVSGGRSSASLTLVFRLVLEAQRRSEPVVWISDRDSVFFPPDAAETGVDLKALAVVWTGRTLDAARAADHLLRSGGFGLVVVDLGLRQASLPLHAQMRLAGLAKKHDCALVCITEKESTHPSIGSLVSLRADTARTERQGTRYRCEVRILKDKRRGPGWSHAEVCHGPDGLC